jgi:predicted dehydrogenase
MTDPIGIALFGTGPAAAIHSRTIEEMPGASVLWSIGRDADKTGNFAVRFGIPHASTNPNDAFNDDRVKAAVFALPPSEQPELAILAVNRGRHILCEKPLAPTSKEAREIRKHANRAGVVAMVNFCYSLAPEIAAIHDILKSGHLGKLQSVDLTWTLSSQLEPDLTYCWKNNRDAGGGVLNIFGSHVFDYLFFDSGDVFPVNATKIIRNEQRKDLDGNEHPVTGEEAVTIWLRAFEDVPVTCHFSLIDGKPEGYRCVARGNSGQMEVANPSLIAHWGPFSLQVSPPWKELCEESPMIGEEGMPILFHRIHAAFQTAIREGKDGAPSLERGIRSLELSESILEVMK